MNYFDELQHFRDVASRRLLSWKLTQKKQLLAWGLTQTGEVVEVE